MDNLHGMSDKNKKELPFETKNTHRITKIGDSV